MSSSPFMLEGAAIGEFERSPNYDSKRFNEGVILSLSIVYRFGSASFDLRIGF
jgi:hypothetical protein